MVTIVKEQKYNRADFGYEANSRGYMIKYKGKNIGGAGIANSLPASKGRAASVQTGDYCRMAEATIRQIISGNDGHMQKVIDKIDGVV